MSEHVNLKHLRYADLVDNGIVSNRMTLRRWVRSGKFPKPVRLGPNIIAWRADEVQEWAEARAAEHETTSGARSSEPAAGAVC